MNDRVTRKTDPGMEAAACLDQHRPRRTSSDTVEPEPNLHQRSPGPFLTGGFLFLILMLIATIAFGLSQMALIRASLEQVVEEYNVHGSLAQEMQRSSRERSMLLHAMRVAQDPFERDELFIEIRRLGSQFLETRERLLEMNLGAEERALLDRQSRLSKTASLMQYQVIDLFAENRAEEGDRVLLRDAIPAQERALRVMDAFIALQQQHNQAALEVTSEAFQHAYRLMLMLGTIMVLIGALVAVHVRRRVREILSALSLSNVKLGKLNAELQQAHERLEQRVAERTAELHQTNEQLRREVSERERAEHRLIYLANYDSVTKLPNRCLFTEHLKLVLGQAKRRQTRVAMLFMDLDGFKQINDSLGHEAGDRLLREVGSRLQGRVRGEDMAARLGGDEFTLILCNLAHPLGAAAVAEKVIDAIAAPFVLEGQPYYVGISIGIALYPDDTIDMDTLIRYADDAMYDVKRSGKNSYSFHRTPAETEREGLRPDQFGPRV